VVCIASNIWDGTYGTGTGLYLLAVWLIENDVTQQGAARSRLPGLVIGGHVLLALTGLVFWVIHLLFGAASWGWAAAGEP
jgi:hypothetical protein